jgi:hypothetical protein
MLLKNKKYDTQAPDRDAKSIYIFCEGVRREKHYFNFFKEFDSRINIVIYDLKDTEDNSATGLGQIVKKSMFSSSNPTGQFELIEGDEVWIVLDTDTHGNLHRVETLKKIRQLCIDENWNIAQSNPCFEVWLYYHQEQKKPEFENQEIPSIWKSQVGGIIKGGFNSKKHPILIQEAIKNAENNFLANRDLFPDIASTEVYKLGENILATGKIKSKIELMLTEMTLK